MSNKKLSQSPLWQVRHGQKKFARFGPAVGLSDSNARVRDFDAEISVGGGVATLSLPDIHFGVLPWDYSQLSNDSNFGDQFGPSITAGIVARGRDQ